MKKLVLLGLLAASVMPLVGCNADIDDLFADKDFDGLYDYEDPTPDDNRSGFLLNNDSINSNEIIVPVDYRNFVYDEKPEFNKDVAKMCAIVVNYSYGGSDAGWSISKSKYTTAESLINPALVQFGFSDLEHVTITANSDSNDVCGLYFGNHLFVNDGNTYQIIMASIEGYPSRTCWYSNLDLGADTAAYYSIDGEHTEWTNKKHHKGFDVTANRALPKIKEYMEKVGDDDYEQIVILTGHSRGGALTNLIGKLLKDNGIKSICYAFNGCTTTTESDEIVLKSYANIFNVDPINDYVPRFPFSHMGFTKYGTTITYDMLQHNDIYKAMYNVDVAANTVSNLDAVDNLAKNVFVSRDEMYEYSDIDPEISEFVLCSSLEEAEEQEKEMKQEIIDANIVNYAKCEILENDDPFTNEESPYKVQYYSRPAILLRFGAKMIVTAGTAENILDEIFKVLNGGIRYISRYVNQILEIGGVELDIAAFATPHVPHSCVPGVMMVED